MPRNLQEYGPVDGGIALAIDLYGRRKMTVYLKRAGMPVSKGTVH